MSTATEEWLWGYGGPQHADGVHRLLPIASAETFPILTPDSDLGEGDGWQDWRVHRVPSPLWLPPRQAAAAFAVKEWRIGVSFAAPDWFPPDLDVETAEFVRAGTSRARYFYNGAETAEAETNMPGWLRVGEGIDYRAHRRPPPDSAEQAERYGFGFYRRVAVASLEPGFEIATSVTVSIRGWKPAWHATRPPDESGPRPRWYGHEGLDEVWFFDVDCLAMAGLVIIGGINPSMESRLIDWDGGQIGRANASGPTGDAAFAVTLEAGSFHAEI